MQTHAELERELLPRLRQQHEPSFNRLVKSYYGSMRALAGTIVGNAFSDEVVQEAWVSIYRALPKFEGRSSLKTWILRVTVNAAKTRLRRESRYLSLEQISGGKSELLPGSFDSQGHWRVPPSGWHDESPEALLINMEMGRCIELTLRMLPELQRAVFTLKELEGNDFGQVCNSLNISLSNARVLLHRARIKLFCKIEAFQETGER